MKTFNLKFLSKEDLKKKKKKKMVIKFEIDKATRDL